jgi:hypothetical protein
MSPGDPSFAPISPWAQPGLCRVILPFESHEASIGAHCYVVDDQVCSLRPFFMPGLNHTLFEAKSEYIPCGYLGRAAIYSSLVLSASTSSLYAGSHLHSLGETYIWFRIAYSDSSAFTSARGSIRTIKSDLPLSRLIL